MTSPEAWLSLSMKQTEIFIVVAIGIEGGGLLKDLVGDLQQLCLQLGSATMFF